MFNELNHPNANGLTAANWLMRLPPCSDPIQSALADVNTRYGKTLTPLIYAPVNSGGDSAYTGWGDLAVANRTVTVTPPSANQPGTATITVIVSDGVLTTSDTFVLTVTGTALETWRFTHFGTTANTGNAADLADANHDGEENVLEYATAQSPSAASLVALTTLRTASALEITYTRSKTALAGGVTFTVEWSDTLAPNSWSSVGVTEFVPPLFDNGIVQTVKAVVPSGAGGTRFVHLKVSPP